MMAMARTVELMGHRERSATPPPEFREVLLAMAADARGDEVKP